MQRTSRLVSDWMGMSAASRCLWMCIAALMIAPAAVSSASQDAVEWLPLTLDEALALAGERNTLVMLDLWATHCQSCGQMDIDVWETPEGVALADGLIPIKIDNQTDDGRVVSSRYPITGLPAILFLRPDGSELGRVEGYQNRSDFLRDAGPLAGGVDPLPGLEARVENNPGDPEIMFELMEAYLFRVMEQEADSLYNRILRADPHNRHRQAEKAIGKMARYQEHFRKDMERSTGYWRFLVENHPTASSAGAGVMNVQKGLSEAGRRAEWLPWICGVLRANPNAPTMQRSAVTTAMRNRYRDPCLAEAARALAAEGGRNAAYFDSVAAILDNP